MNRTVKVFVTAIALMQIYWTSVSPAVAYDLSGGAKAAVLMDVETGEILYQKNGQAQLPPASTTKIMTGILGIELGSKTELVKVSPKAAAVGESSMYLEEGDQFYLEELFYGALLKSGNDACVAIAEQVAGTESDFVHMMNVKAKLLGATNTSFQNTNGLPNKEHFVTARDLACIASYAIQNLQFAQFVQTKEKVVGTWERGGKRFLTNTNRLLWDYSHATGMKTGTTRAAGQCLVASAHKDGRSLVAVVLNSPDRFGTCQNLLEYGFRNFTNQRYGDAGAYYQNISVKNGTRASVPVVFEDDLVVSVAQQDRDRLVVNTNMSQQVLAPIHRGQKIGICQICLDGRVLSQTNLRASADCEQKPVTRRWMDSLSEYLPWNS